MFIIFHILNISLGNWWSK